MKVKFVSLSGSCIFLEIDDSSISFTVSMKLCEALKIPQKQFIFIFNDKMLTSNTKFSDLKIDENTPVFYKAVEQKRKLGIKEIPIITNLQKKSIESLESVKRRDGAYKGYLNVIKREEKQSRNDPPRMNKLVESVMQMGYSKDDAIKALRRNNYDTEGAVNDLLGTLRFSDESLNRIIEFMPPELRRHMLRRELIKDCRPSKGSPYFEFFDEERILHSEDSGYSRAAEKAAQSDYDRIQRSIEREKTNFNANIADLKRLLSDDTKSKEEKRQIRKNMRMAEIEYRGKEERLNDMLAKAKDKLDRILEEKREANIEDDEPDVAVPTPISPRAQRGNPQKDSGVGELLRLVSPEERQMLQALVSDKCTFAEIIQLYLINERNLEATKAMLGLG